MPVRAVLTIVATIVGLVVIGGGIVSLVGNGITSAAQGRTFSATLRDEQERFGDGAKVVKVEADGSGVEYDVLSPDNSTALIRNYTVTSEDLGGGTTGYNNHTDDSQRPAKPADVQSATVTLGQLNKDMVDHLWDQADFPHSGSTAVLQGTTWTIGSGAHPFDKYQANLDGSGFHQTQNQSDVFGNGATTTAQAPAPAPSGVPQAAVKQARAIAACMRRAQGDVSKIRACVGK